MAHPNDNRGSQGSFADDRERAREAGRKGGEHSHEKQSGHEKQQSQSGGDRRRQGGSGNFADDPNRAREAGRKGGQH